jgi:hypothetical protein
MTINIPSSELEQGASDLALANMPLSTVPNNHFATLAPELLEKIFIRSESLSSLCLVNRHFYASLRSETALLRFCTHVFYHGSRRKLAKIVVTQESGGRIDDKTHHKAQIEMGKLQTAILEQDWFTASFAKKLTKAVKKLQMGEPSDASIDPRTVHYIFDRPVDTSLNYAPNHFTCAWSTTWPSKLSQGPWTYAKLDLVGCINSWCLSLDRDHTMVEKVMRDAITENNFKAVMRLNRTDFKFTHDLFKLAVLSYCDKDIIKNMFFFSFFSISSSEILAWAVVELEEGDKRRERLVNAINDCRSEFDSEDEWSVSS